MGGIIYPQSYDKRLISKICKALVELNKKRKIQHHPKWKKMDKTSLEDKYRWPEVTWFFMCITNHQKDANQNKFKQWDTISNHRDWHTSKRTRTISAGMDAGRKGPSLTAGGDLHWSSHWETIWTYAPRAKVKKRKTFLCFLQHCPQ